MTRAGSRAAAAALLSALALLAASCAASSGSTSDPSARYFPSSQPTAAGPSPAAGSANTGSSQPAVGPVARPNPRLTPGVVAVRDVTAVCQQPKRTRAAIPFAQQQAVFYEYRIGPQASASYGLDYLVPLQLGGSTVLANIWPAPVTGIGFHEKEQLNYRLRLLVCQGGMPLDQAQHQVVSDWYSLWVKYATPGDIASASAH
jgi:hypothetical protein